MAAFYAHSGEHNDRSDWQPLADHLNAVGQLAAVFAAHFSAEELACVAGLLHDLGKYTEEFQLRLSGDYGRVDHSTWGARIACERYGQLGKLLAYGIAGHHAGLANGRDPGERTALSDRLRAELPCLLSAWRDEIALPLENGLVVLGIVLLVVPSPKEIAELRAQVEYFEGMGGKAVFIRCGDDKRLCAEIDLKASEYGERGQYRILKGY